MAQIRSTIELEMKLAKQSWLDMVRTPGMRRRVLIAAMIGLFGQMSGNTLLSYYSNLLFQTMGYTTSYGKTRINLANQCWSLLVGVTAALLVARFPRRIMVSCTPVALNAINWKFLAIYCGWIFFEFIFIYFCYPETSGRTLEELSFLFEDKALAEQAVESVEKVVHNDDALEMDPDLKKAGVVRVESVQPKELY